MQAQYRNPYQSREFYHSGAICEICVFWLHDIFMSWFFITYFIRASCAFWLIILWFLTTCTFCSIFYFGSFLIPFGDMYYSVTVAMYVLYLAMAIYNLCILAHYNLLLWWQELLCIFSSNSISHLSIIANKIIWWLWMQTNMNMNLFYDLPSLNIWTLHPSDDKDININMNSHILVFIEYLNYPSIQSQQAWASRLFNISSRLVSSNFNVNMFFILIFFFFTSQADLSHLAMLGCFFDFLVWNIFESFVQSFL